MLTQVDSGAPEGGLAAARGNGLHRVLWTMRGMAAHGSISSEVTEQKGFAQGVSAGSGAGGERAFESLVHREERREGLWGVNRSGEESAFLRVPGGVPGTRWIENARQSGSEEMEERLRDLVGAEHMSDVRRASERHGLRVSRQVLQAELPQGTPRSVVGPAREASAEQLPGEEANPGEALPSPSQVDAGEAAKTMGQQGTGKEDGSHRMVVRAAPSAPLTVHSSGAHSATTAGQDALEGATRSASPTLVRAGSSQAAVVEQVTARIADLAPGRSVTIALDPQELGKVLLRFVRQGKEWRVRIVAERADAAAALARELPRLESALTRGPENLRVEVALEGDGAAHGQGGGAAEQPHEDAGRHPTLSYAQTIESGESRGLTQTLSNGVSSILDVVT